MMMMEVVGVGGARTGRETGMPGRIVAPLLPPPMVVMVGMELTKLYEREGVHVRLN